MQRHSIIRAQDEPVLRQSRSSISDVWGERTPFRGERQWPVRIDELLSEEPERWVQSACVLCSNGCGLDIGVKGGRIVGVRGRAVDAVNHGRLGPKGLHGWRANNSPDRLTDPLIRSGNRLLKASWDEAMDLVVSRSKEIIRRYTGSAIGFYTCSSCWRSTTRSVSSAKPGSAPRTSGSSRICIVRSSIRGEAVCVRGARSAPARPVSVR